MPGFLKKKLIHPVDITPTIQPVQNYILEEKAVIIKDLEKVKLRLHNLIVDMLNNENDGKSEKNMPIKLSDKSDYNQQFNEILELMREFSVTLKTFNEVTVRKAQTVSDNLPGKIAYLKNNHTIDALRSSLDFFIEAQLNINNAARQLLVENAKLGFEQQVAIHSETSCCII